MRISLLGLGSVGTNFLRIMDDPENRRKITEITGSGLDILTVTDSAGTFSSSGLDMGSLRTMKADGSLHKKMDKLDSKAITDMEPDVIVDTSPASKDGKRELDIYLEAFRKGISVVTANKSPLALHWNTIHKGLSSSGSSLLYEATVAGGVPLFSFIRGTCAPSTIMEFTGIVSLTVNVVLRRIASGMTFADAISECQKEGIAEADYRDDIDGIDAARKTVILSNSLFGTGLTLRDVKPMGVEDAMKIADWKRKNIRIMTKITRDDHNVRVFTGPVELKTDDPFLSLGEMSMGYSIKTSYNGDLFVSSMKDGPLETASAVCNDLFTISRQLKFRK